MKRRTPLLTRWELRAQAIRTRFPDPVPYAARGPGKYNLAGAYMACRGCTADDDADDSIRFPSAGTLSDQLVRDNRLLGLSAAGLAGGHEWNSKVLLADLYAEAILLCETRRHLDLASRLLDDALYLSKKQVLPDSPPLQRLTRVLDTSGDSP
jgi:hypothetical protein